MILALQPILVWGWYFKAMAIGGLPAYTFYDTNSKIVFHLSENPGGVDDFSVNGGAVAIAWWDIKGRKHCHVSLVGRDMREFKRIDLGECGSARIGIDSNGLKFVVLYSKPELSGEGCLIEGWNDGKLFYEKHVGECDGGDVFMKDENVDYVVFSKGFLETSWGEEMKCEKVIFGGRWVECGGRKFYR